MVLLCVVNCFVFVLISVVFLLVFVVVGDFDVY